jgi:hypothetical protein
MLASSCIAHVLLKVVLVERRDPDRPHVASHIEPLHAIGRVSAMMTFRETGWFR